MMTSRTCLALALAAALAVAGCGSGSDSADRATPENTEATPSTTDLDYEVCTVYDNSGDAAVTFTGFGASQLCKEFIQKWAASGSYWTPRDHGAYSERMVVCILGASEWGGTVEVDDTGSAVVGNDICAQFVATGWTEGEVPPGD